MQSVGNDKFLVEGAEGVWSRAVAVVSSQAWVPCF